MKRIVWPGSRAVYIKKSYCGFQLKGKQCFEDFPQILLIQLAIVLFLVRRYDVIEIQFLKGWINHVIDGQFFICVYVSIIVYISQYIWIIQSRKFFFTNSKAEGDDKELPVNDGSAGPTSGSLLPVFISTPSRQVTKKSGYWVVYYCVWFFHREYSLVEKIPCMVVLE